MDLQELFKSLNQESSACLLLDQPREQTWRIVNVNYQALNYLRNWLQQDIISVAFNWTEFFENTTTTPDEIWSHRIGLIPLSAEPLELDDYYGKDPKDCEENTCLIFELNIRNTSNQQIDVTSKDLVWKPLGQQARLFSKPPKPTFPDILIAKLSPGKTIHLLAYAIRGTPKEHIKWSTVNAFYRLVPTRGPLQTKPGGQPFKDNPKCPPCENLPLEVEIGKGLGCYYFTLRLIGGLTFEQVGKQLAYYFSWADFNLSQVNRYRFEL